MTVPPEPHRIVLDRPYWCALVAAASLLLSLWAIYLDPVIDSVGVSDVRAAQYFHDGEWRAGIEAAGRPVYALLAAVLMGLTGMTAAYSGYALSAGFLALLVVGFMTLVAALGGGRPAQVMAALVVLLFPSLNELRAGIIGDTGYWACYVWSLAYFMHYAATSNRGSLGTWAATVLAASLLAVEALVFLLWVPLWLYAYHAGRHRRILKILALAAGTAVILCYLLWMHAWHADSSPGWILLHPLDRLGESWQALTRTWEFKLAGLRGDFLDQYSQGYGNAALLVTLLAVSAAGLVKGLGLVYAAMAGYALAALKWTLPASRRYWWGVFAVLSLVLLLVPAATGFAVDERDAMIASLTILAVVPLALERLWRRRGAERRYRRWALPALLVLVLAAGVKGLDLRGDRFYLREAGLWLRANAAPDSHLYSNSRIVVYYSGLEGYRPAVDYSWREAMNTVQRGTWRNYDYLALELERSNPHREGILMRSIDIEPVKAFSNDEGNRVLIFDARTGS